MGVVTVTVHTLQLQLRQGTQQAAPNAVHAIQFLLYVHLLICCSLTYHSLHVCKNSSCANNCTTYAASTGSEICKIEAVPVCSEDCTFLKALILKESSIKSFDDASNITLFGCQVYAWFLLPSSIRSATENSYITEVMCG